MTSPRASRILALSATLLFAAASVLPAQEGGGDAPDSVARSQSSGVLPEADAEVTGNLQSLSIEQLTQVNVTSAALHEQLIKRAPADITVVTADEIQRYGWRTLGEIINHVRGFYVTYDHTYQEAGTAGYSIPGDWSTRILVLVDGHNMTDNIFGSASYFDEDFVVDMTLVDRIEIMRGASSSLYGTNGILATISIITKRPGSSPGISVRSDTGTMSQKRGTLTGSWQMPGGMALLGSATVFNDGGQHDIYVPEYSGAATNYGNAINMDGDRGYRVFADLIAGNWEILAFAGTRVKIQPISWDDTVFNDRGTRAIDHRAAVVATWARKFGGRRSLSWSSSWDQYTYNGTYLYPLTNDDVTGASGIDTNKEYDSGQWLTSTVTYKFPFFRGSLTAGAEAKLDLRALESEADILPYHRLQLDTNRLDRSTAGFLQQEWKLGASWDFTAGTRYDWSYYRSSALSPRFGIVFQATPATTLKLIFGRGFRDPNANELLFSDGNQNVANPALKPEQADSMTAGIYRDITKRWTGGLTAYRIIDKRIIVPMYTAGGASEFVNADEFHGIGLGGEIQGRPSPWMDVNASFQLQQSWLENRTTLPNSPRGVGKMRLSVPLKGRALLLSGGILYESERRSLAGARLNPVWLPEVTLAAKNLPLGIDLQAGVRNLSNTRYVDPIGLTPSVDTILQPGRTFFLTAQHRF